jgi:hypothetical protein
MRIRLKGPTTWCRRPKTECAPPKLCKGRGLPCSGEMIKIILERFEENIAASPLHHYPNTVRNFADYLLRVLDMSPDKVVIEIEDALVHDPRQFYNLCQGLRSTRNNHEMGQVSVIHRAFKMVYDLKHNNVKDELTIQFYQSRVRKGDILMSVGYETETHYEEFTNYVIFSPQRHRIGTAPGIGKARYRFGFPENFSSQANRSIRKKARELFDGTSKKDFSVEINVSENVCPENWSSIINALNSLERRFNQVFYRPNGSVSLSFFKGIDEKLQAEIAINGDNRFILHFPHLSSQLNLRYISPTTETDPLASLFTAITEV